ncbi:hypothetical protein KAFR_0H02810 [Kazachstania africana CBS 2517]|uniref:Uncharacterized protein n=1 Tax=Kazachstania africana (strain ATCC 22294 / BCRC 22015 / CBS 2517 / CECT 1963 / NBRC 1671 / NRRL Y-8276) TaxID=1071382 RepID=H2AZD4_KAZAF|nr:hypothetical protein KAFR_0H02810 [Kazachstania africana CBS 2517]CCF59690.1 hypothetical protein KAFR_0H02810 [Kazachstania africana CBS 2517]
MSTISQLLRQTKLSQVPRPRVGGSKSRCYPTHQIIETKPSTLSHQEWGLKSTLPSKIRTRYIELDALDSLERMTKFEPNGGNQWIRLRFQEMGVVPSYQTGKVNPLFHKDGSSYESLTEVIDAKSGQERLNRRKIEQIKQARNDFKKWLIDKHAMDVDFKHFNATTLKNLAIEFLNEQINTKRLKFPRDRVIGNGGLSYKLKGRLDNSPNGVVTKHIVPGRMVNSSHQNQNVAAIGGFIARSLGENDKKNSYNKGDFIRELVYPFTIENVTMKDNGKTEIQARCNTSLNASTRHSIMSYQYQQRQLNSRTKKKNKILDPDEVKKEYDSLVETLKGMRKP